MHVLLLILLIPFFHFDSSSRVWCTLACTCLWWSGFAKTLFRHFKAVVSKHFGFEPIFVSKLNYCSNILAGNLMKQKLSSNILVLNDFLQFCVSMQHYCSNIFEATLVSNILEKSFEFMERQLKKPFVSKQDVSRIRVYSNTFQ